MAPNQSSKRKKVLEVESAIGFADSLLEIHTMLTFSPSERRSYVKQMNVLWNRLQNRKRFIQYHHYFFVEAAENGVPWYNIGSYLAQRLKDSNLPTLSRSYNP
jgi:hypothetical protein